MSWNITKHATPEYAPQYGIYKDDSRSDFCIVRGEDAKTNARLIAAAPDLLEACKYAAELFAANKGCDDWWEEYGDPRLKKLESAIAKAEQE